MRQIKAKMVLNQIQETYNKIAGEFSVSRRNLVQDYHLFRPYLKGQRKIVDLGCGNGRIVDLLKQTLSDFDYVGIDNSVALLDQARAIYADQRFIFGDQLKIPLDNASSDLIFNVRAFHHLPTHDLMRQSLKEMQRVLQDDGLLLLTVWNIWKPGFYKYILDASWRSLLSLGESGYKDTLIPWGNGKIDRYYYAFTLGELVKLVRQAGFEIVEVKKGSDLFIAARKSRRIRIMNVPFDHVDLKTALKLVLDAIHAKKQYFIATPNPEMLLEARSNEAFRQVLNKTNLNVADGFGIKLAAKWQGTPLQERVTGIDLMESICAGLPRDIKVFLLGAAEGVAKQTALKLRNFAPQIKIVGTYAGSPAQSEEQQICDLINASEAEVLFVAFGAPKQELWLSRNLVNLNGVHVAMGVGGAFDFIAGVRKRAPIWMQKLGLEWLFRLIQQPSRFKRIFNATVVFPFLFWKDRFWN